MTGLYSSYRYTCVAGNACLSGVISEKPLLSSGRCETSRWWWGYPNFMLREEPRAPDTSRRAVVVVGLSELYVARGRGRSSCRAVACRVRLSVIRNAMVASRPFGA